MRKSLLMLPLLVSFLLMPLAVFAQQGPAGTGTDTATGPKSGAAYHHKGTARSKMAAQCEKWKAEFKAMDDRLNEKVTAMNSAQGDDKVAAMAAVLNELVTQRTEMREKLAEIHHGGMGRLCGSMMERHRGMHGGMSSSLERHHGGAGTGTGTDSSS